MSFFMLDKYDILSYYDFGDTTGGETMRNKIFLIAVVILILLLGSSYLEETGRERGGKGMEVLANAKPNGWIDTQIERFNTCSILYVTV